jgi:Ca2+-binding RTX toxin-like protein
MDKLDGGAGNDTLDGGDDRVIDILNAGAGNDRVTIREADVALGGTGIDKLTLFTTSHGRGKIEYHIDLTGISGKKAAAIGYGDAKAGQFEKASVTIYDAAVNSTITGSKGDDSINVYGSEGSVKTFGGSGHDILETYTLKGGNTLDGGAGSDKLTGHGLDTLIGGAGSDLFVAVLDSGGNTILDFGAKDHILVRKSLGFLNIDKASLLVANAAPSATSARGQFLYDTDDGRLLYDSDGTGATAAALVFTLANKAALNSSSFLFDF